MARPLDVQFVAELKIRANVFSYQLIYDHAIINALYRNAVDDELSFLLANFRNARDFYPEQLLRR